MRKGLNKNDVSCAKAWTKMIFTFQEWKTRYDAASELRDKISSKVEEKEIAPTGPQSVHGQEVDEFNKKKDHKRESNAHTFHSCKVIHPIAFTHYIRYMFSYLKQECRVKKGLALNKSFRKTFGEKESNSNRSKFWKNFESQPD